MRKQINHSLALVVFKLYVQAILDANFHLNWTVGVRVARQSVHGNVHLTDDVTQTAYDRYSKKVPTVPRKKIIDFQRLQLTHLQIPTLNERSIQRTPRRVFQRWQIQTDTRYSG